MEPKEGNKLIEVFMELVVDGHNWADKNGELVYFGHYSPDSEWDILMPVVERIWNMGYMIHVQYYQSEAENCTCRIYTAAMHISPWVGGGKTPINSYYEAVIQFIQWYNQSKTTQP